MFAADAGDGEVCALLLRAGADPFVTWLKTGGGLDLRRLFILLSLLHIISYFLKYHISMSTALLITPHYYRCLIVLFLLLQGDRR